MPIEAWLAIIFFVVVGMWAAIRALPLDTGFALTTPLSSEEERDAIALIEKQKELEEFFGLRPKRSSDPRQEYSREVHDLLQRVFDQKPAQYLHEILERAKLSGQAPRRSHLTDHEIEQRREAIAAVIETYRSRYQGVALRSRLSYGILRAAEDFSVIIAVNPVATTLVSALEQRSRFLLHTSEKGKAVREPFFTEATLAQLDPYLGERGKHLGAARVPSGGFSNLYDMRCWVLRMRRRYWQPQAEEVLLSADLRPEFLHLLYGLGADEEDSWIHYLAVGYKLSKKHPAIAQAVFAALRNCPAAHNNPKLLSQLPEQ